MRTFFAAESDATCGKNSFAFLAMRRECEWILNGCEQNYWLDELLKIRLNALSHLVKYEATVTLTTLRQNPAAVKGAVVALLIHRCPNSLPVWLRRPVLSTSSLRSRTTMSNSPFSIPLIPFTYVKCGTVLNKENR
jgi:hypothetical protein